jgi:hypothetical protein
VIFDNEYALSTARRLMSQYQGDELARQISGELMRFYTLGKYAAIAPVQKALDQAEKKRP